ncbi:hypothetical protein [Muricauda sp. MAR_2010_75]|uniref:hypothetical protein n=1 Tax=Allomuricauda sp. MAR_2010_75 TaxID=1250232 RepID=UPI00056229B2|nr:hypothetical protein [Muricauda sp. MAR_2010_75]
MNEKEDYFRIHRNGQIHTLSDRIPFRWKELLLFSSASILFLIFWLSWFAAIYVAILTTIVYVFYRFAAWIYYLEIQIDVRNGKITKLKKLLNKVQKVELITDKFNPNRFEYIELSRSGKTKYLLNYRTHKNNELLILKNKRDKEIVENYIKEHIGSQIN